MTYMLREPLWLISPLYFEAWLRSRNKLLRITYTNIAYCSEFLEEPVLKTASNWKLWFPLHLTLFYTAVTSLGAGYVSPITCYSKTYVVLLKAILNVWPFSQLSPCSFVFTNKFVLLLRLIDWISTRFWTSFSKCRLLILALIS